MVCLLDRNRLGESFGLRYFVESKLAESRIRLAYKCSYMATWLPATQLDTSVPTSFLRFPAINLVRENFGAFVDTWYPNSKIAAALPLFV